MKEIISIIHDKETEKFFKCVGLYEQLVRQKIECISCQDPITINNFRGVFKKDDILFFICNKTECYTLHPNTKLEESKNV